MGSEIFAQLKKGLKAAGHNTNVGDEGGFAPGLKSADEALAFISTAGREAAGYRPGEDVTFALDCAATEFYRNGRRLRDDRRRQVVSTAPAWWPTSRTWPRATRSSRSRTASPRTTGKAGRTSPACCGGKLQLVGDDLFVTNPERLRRGIAAHTANSILVKVNQIGTLSETLEAVELAHKAGYTAVMSHRSGETEDATIADLAVATNCGQIKTGSLSRSDRTAKYNQLIRIEQELGSAARYAGRTILRH